MIKLDGEGTVIDKQPFATGWSKQCSITQDSGGGAVWSGEQCARPVDVVQYTDGSLLVSDDFAGAVYRVAYGSQCTQQGAPPPSSGN